MNAVRAVSRAYLAGTPPARRSRGVGAGGSPAVGLRARRGGLPAELPDQFGGGKAKASVGTFSEVLRAGWKAA